MAENKGLTFKGRPLMRKDNIIYYGSMADISGPLIIIPSIRA